MSVAIFGIRHHGPGSARSVVRALDAYGPDAVLVEGPPEASAIAVHAADDAMRPPVAILAYAAQNASRALIYPFAAFSPEWQTLRWALARDVPVSFVDLPLANVLAEHGDDDDDDDDVRERDPLEPIARAAGYADGERFWDALVERRSSDVGAFEALDEMMAALREERGEPPPSERRREAAMRVAIRAAEKRHGRVAFVCGAWHAPAVRDRSGGAADAEILRGLAKTKVESTWIPWTHGRLGYASGYGAGVESPGWYEHLWLEPHDPVAGWMTKAARALRGAKFDIGPAHAIEATRLAHTLAALRDVAMPGLSECDDAIRSIYCFGDALPMRLIDRQLVVGERLGTVPDHVANVPLAADVAREQKRLRLPPETSARVLDLDLRKANDLDRSRLVHRLTILGVPWGRDRNERSAISTFHERFDLAWHPEFAIRLVESAPYGNTVETAANARVREVARRDGIPLDELTKLLHVALAADLAAAAEDVLRCVRDGAARTHDASILLDAVPPLAHVRRYGDVRQTDATRVGSILGDLITRGSLALPGACFALDDDAAEATFARIVAVDAALHLTDDPRERDTWDDALRRVHDAGRTHGLVAARALRLRLDAGRIDVAEVGRRAKRELGNATSPDRAAAWIDGLVRGSGAILVHQDGLLRVLDAWLVELGADAFIATLPLIRRTFSTFAAPERATIGRHLAGSLRRAERAGDFASDDAIVWERALLGIPTLAAVLGRDR